MKRSIFPVLISISLAGQALVPAFAAASQPDVNFKIYSDNTAKSQTTPSGKEETPVLDTASTSEAQANATNTASAKDATKDAPAAASGDSTESASTDSADGQKIASKVLQGYIRVVPSGTKIPIIMDTAVDSDTSQEGDEFSARTAEDLNIDGNTVVPAGSIIKGRIAQINAPRRMDRSGSVALKFDTVTTPDNRQIPLVANIVAHGGVVHAKRGMKDVAIETSLVAVPVALGLGIGAIAGHSSSSLGVGTGALLGAGVGVAVGTIILLAKKGKRVDVRPGDELKIELAEDLRMPM